MYSSVNDLANITKAFFRNADTDQNTVFVGSSIREMLTPSFINPDKLSGFSSPWEMRFLENSRYWANTKGGIFPGYSAFWAMVPEVKFGYVSQQTDHSSLECSEDVLNMLMFDFHNVLVHNQPLEPSPPNVADYVGNYVSTLFFLQVNAQVVLNPDGRTLAYSLGLGGFPSIPQKVKWISGNDFQVDSTERKRTILGSCAMNQMGGDHEWISFQRNSNNEVVSFVLPFTDPYFGLVFQKK